MLSAAPALAHTDDDPAPPQLPEVIVSAPAEPGVPPGTITIETEALQRRQASTMAEVFAAEPSVSVGGGARNAQRLYLRGLEGSTLNITIDGARQGRNLHQHRGSIGGIEPELLKQVDIHTLPTAEHGSGALGGGIRFTTVDAQDLLTPGRAFGGMVRGSYASADGAQRGSTTLYGLAGERIGLLANLSATNSDDYRRGDGQDVPLSAGRDRDYLLKLSALDISGHSLRLGASRNSNTGLYLFGSVGSDMGYAPDGAVPTRQKIQRETYTLEHRYQPGHALIDWQLNLFANRNELSDYDANRGAQTHDAGGALRNTFRFDLGQTQHRLTAGLDYLSEEGITLGNMGGRMGAGRKTSKARNLGLFVQERMQWGPLALSLGGRYDDFASDYGPLRFEDSAFSPNAGIEFHFTPAWSAFAGYAEAVRGTGAIPMGFLTRTDAATNFNDGQPFQPESSATRELGIQLQGNDTLRSGDRASARLSVFDTRIDNLIEWVGGGMTYPAHIRNMPEQLRSKGWELRLGWGWQGLQTNLGIVSADTTAGGQPLGNVRRKGASLGDRLSWDTRWQIAPEWSLGYTLTAIKRLSDVPAGAIERPGYALHDLQVQWQPAQVRGLEIGLAIQNLGDKFYSSQTSLAGGADNILHEPGRDIRLSLRYRF